MSPGAWAPTHTVPTGGLKTFVNGNPAAALGAGLHVQVAESSAGWARIVCENGWEAWVDADGLVPIAPSPAGPAPTWHPTPAAVKPAAPAPVALSSAGPAPTGHPTPVTPMPAGLYPAQAARAANGAAVPAPRRRRPKRLLVVGIAVLVLLIAGGGVFAGTRLLVGNGRPAVADNLFTDQAAAAGQLTAGLDKPMPVPRHDVGGLFESYPMVEPGKVYPPPLGGGGPLATSLPVAADGDTVDVQVAGAVPDDFKAFIAAAAAGGVADYDKLYADADFNFTADARPLGCRC